MIEASKPHVQAIGNGGNGGGTARSNVKTGLLLAALALVFFLTVVLKYVFIR